MFQDERADKSSKSWLLTYLPDIYQGDEFLGAFLSIFEGVWESFDGRSTT